MAVLGGTKVSGDAAQPGRDVHGADNYQIQIVEERGVCPGTFCSAQFLLCATENVHCQAGDAAQLGMQNLLGSQNHDAGCPRGHEQPGSAGSVQPWLQLEMQHRTAPHREESGVRPPRAQPGLFLPRIISREFLKRIVCYCGGIFEGDPGAVGTR